MSLEPWMADFIIDNNGTLEQLWRNVDDLYDYLTFGDYKDLVNDLLS
jgi:dephospho-CoA kinase